MKQLRNYLLVVGFVIALTTMSIAQVKHGGGAASQDAETMIVGQVIDSETKEPIEFATVSVFNPSDNSLMGGSITNEKGKFKVIVPLGTYKVKVSFVSFEDLEISNVTVGQGKKIANLGEISLSESAEMLSEVEVVAKKGLMQIEMDKKVFNAGQDVSNIGGTAADLLDNIPSVTVDVEGNVELRGSSNVRILIDGQQSGLIGIDGSSGLQNIPSNLIDKVEVVTNPSARYDAEGMGGIINIVLKKDKKNGVNGTFDMNLGIPHNHNASINMNYRREKLNFFGLYGIRYRESPGSGYTKRSLFDENGELTSRLDQLSDFSRNELSHTFRFGADYNIDSKNTLTGSFLYKLGDQNSLSHVDYYDYDNSGNLTSASIRDSDETADDNNLDYSLVYRRTFDTKGKEFTANVQYTSNWENEFSDIVEKPLIDLIASDEDPIFQRSTNDESQSNLVFQADYEQKIGETGIFEAGYKGSIREISNDYIVEENIDGSWGEIDGVSNEFVYNEDIHAVYGIYGNKIKKLSYQIGLRAETTEIATNLIRTDDYNTKTYTNFFPSGHLSYSLPKSNQVQLSYSRRLRRPRFRYLAPFWNYSNPWSIRSGNPDLDPEFTDSYEIGHLKDWENVSISSSIYYRYATGVIQWVSEVDEDGVTYSRPENLATGQNFGAELVTSSNITKWWKLNANFNFFRNITDGGNLGEEYYADSYTWTAGANSKMTLFESLDFQVMFNYRAPQETVQGKRLAYSYLDLAFSKDVMKGKATTFLRVSDVFNTRKYSSETFGESFFTETQFQRRSRQVIFGFSYRLNQKKKRGGGGRREYDGDGGDMF
ncbi:TonB-dependent receptor [Flammeovirgaceae bacterium SG7u.111]|nr:TonB-dependent receptor [Flammeovirgaceae bacterium SG7u.132]WPO34782.1 TonB-dependent receptor [Flammeovirgaceae bacterium SG7u.111]